MLLTKLGELLRRDYDWSKEVATIEAPTMLVVTVGLPGDGLLLQDGRADANDDQWEDTANGERQHQAGAQRAERGEPLTERADHAKDAAANGAADDRARRAALGTLIFPHPRSRTTRRQRAPTY